ncbi:hypothetical protein BU23DRAFT_564463 [Bimuria novae-zelandiae CBS 107.79]|uniref:C3H1-type domain-containing protein n=1 Tax=Bimuria novae-zelandiae CBS 107.79 TaxID=1447943 RepID=A0A6A5VND0_9PLEO|nr:hypothetical protein BU23DRAFT_564463 [Bimuria novae-zelandiae CBS 107.79]
MPSASTRRVLAQIAKAKANAAAACDIKNVDVAGPYPQAHQEKPISVKNSDGDTVVSYVNAKGDTVFSTENQDLINFCALPFGPWNSEVWWGSRPDVGFGGQKTRKSLAQAFEWSVDSWEWEADSPYNAANSKSAYHKVWLMAQGLAKGPKMYAGFTVPLVLLKDDVDTSFQTETTKQFGKDTVSPSHNPTKPTDPAVLEEWKRQRFGSTECAYWAKGQCKNGAECKFLRPAEKARTTSTSSSSSQEEYKRRRYGVTECAFWAKGQCKNGDNCKFLHSAAKAPKSNAANDNVYWFWRQGRCTKGDACAYDHFE